MALEGMFLTWERHQRTRSLVAHLGLTLREVVIVGPRYRRYWGQIAATLGYLRRERPALIVLQNPSLVLNVLVLCWRAITRTECVIVMDAHNEAVEPIIVTWWWWRALAAWALRTADFTMVTNRFLAQKVVQQGGRPLVLPDPVPDVAPSGVPPLAAGEALRLLVIATYAKDEPIEPILEAARALQGQIEFQFTGNFRKLPEQVLSSAPPNVKFLGFLSEADYWQHMRDAHAVLDFTLMEDCLVCGAYEAVAVGRPMVLSDTRALQEFFRLGSVYARAEPRAIVAAIRRLRAEYEPLSEQITALRALLQTEWSACRSQAESVIIAAITRKAP